MRKRFEPADGGRPMPVPASCAPARHAPPAYRARRIVGTVLVAFAAAVVAGCGKGQVAASAHDGPATPVATLPEATTYTTLRGVPQDPHPFASSDGTLVHPTAPVPISATPGGPPVAVLPDKQLGSPTWVPVVETKAGWWRVLLPSRPNHASGWLAADAGKLRTARTTYVIKVDLSARDVVILNSGHTVGTWTVAVGSAATPTPTGRTFLLASLAPARPTYSPLILPLGVHSDSLDSFGGGPGTVAFHGWPQTSVFGQAITHGCVRVPAAALRELSRIPLGSPVFIAA